MPRRLIIVLLVFLILVILGGTVTLVWQRLGGGNDDNEPPAVATLPDSRPANEGTAGRPAASGQPILPGAAQPELPEAPLQVDQYFEEGLKITNDEDVTAEYRKAHKEEEQTPETLDSFISSQPIITKLPTPAQQKIVLAKSDSAVSIDAYLNIADRPDVLANQALLADALQQLFEKESSSGFVNLSQTTRLYQQRLWEAEVPPSAEPLHRLLLGYTELLMATFEQISGYADDPVKSMVGMRQLEQIDSTYYPLIQREISRLSALGG